MGLLLLLLLLLLFIFIGECIKLLRDKMMSQYIQYRHTRHSKNFRRPKFRVAVLYIDEKLSVTRQLSRGEKVIEHNRRVKSGELHEEMLEERVTDFSEKAAKHRYEIFLQHYDTLKGLREHFAFTLINASGPIEEVEKSIEKEFAYQSSLELAEETFEVLRTIPLVEEVTKHARQVKSINQSLNK